MQKNIAQIRVHKRRPNRPIYEAKSTNKNLTILVDSESEVFTSTAIAALQLSAFGLDFESRTTRIIDTNWSISWQS